MSPARNPDTSFSLDHSESSPSPASASPSRSRVSRGIYVPVTTDGKLDESRIRNSADIERVKNALGVAAVAPEVEKEKLVINRDFIPQAYSLLEMLIQRGGIMLLKWPTALAVEMVFSPEKKQELVEPTAKVLEKYAPTWLVQNQEVAALVAALSSAVNEMVTAGSERYIAKVRAATQQPPPPPITVPVNGHAGDGIHAVTP